MKTGTTWLASIGPAVGSAPSAATILPPGRKIRMPSRRAAGTSGKCWSVITERITSALDDSRGIDSARATWSSTRDAKLDVARSWRADERNGFAFVSPVNAKIRPIDSDDRVLWVKLAHADDAEIGEIRL